MASINSYEQQLWLRLQEFVEDSNLTDLYDDLEKDPDLKTESGYIAVDLLGEREDVTLTDLKRRKTAKDNVTAMVAKRVKG